MTAEVVDVRPDRFLRAMRDTGNWYAACDQAGMTSVEVEELCRKNAKFDKAQLECQLEFHEERIIEATEKAIEKAREERAARIALMRQKAMAEFDARRAADEQSD